MIRDEMLSLPQTWETMLEHELLRKPIGLKCERVYICSPLRADSPDAVIRNIKAARVYMFYAYYQFAGVPKAPHAYLPFLLNDNAEDERALALSFGKKLLQGCDKLFVCGDRLSEGMYGEIKAAARLGIYIEVFNKEVYAELCKHLEHDGIDPDAVWHEDGHLHFALTWGAEKIASYWESDSNA